MYRIAAVIAVMGVLVPFGIVSAADCTSRFGKDDQIGNANYITSERTLAATKLVTEGKAYRLGIETNRGTPAYPPRNYSVTVVQPGQVAGTTIGPTKLSYNDDIVMGWDGVGSTSWRT